MLKPWDEVTDPRAVPAMRWWREISAKRTQSEVAQAIGLHRSTYNQIEKGRQALTYRHMRDLAAYYGTDEAGFLASVTAPVEPRADSLPVLRRLAYEALGRLAGLGASEEDVQGARTLLLAPVVSFYLQDADDTGVRTAMTALLDAVVIPALQRAGKISGAAG